MANANKNNPHFVPVRIGNQSATATFPALYASTKIIIKRMTVLNGANLAADDVNFLQIQLLHGSDVLAEVDTRAANEGALVAFEGKHAPETDIDIGKGWNLAVRFVKNGAPPTANAMTAQLELYAL